MIWKSHIKITLLSFIRKLRLSDCNVSFIKLLMDQKVHLYHRKVHFQGMCTKRDRPPKANILHLGKYGSITF